MWGLRTLTHDPSESDSSAVSKMGQVLDADMELSTKVFLSSFNLDIKFGLVAS